MSKLKKKVKSDETTAVLYGDLRTTVRHHTLTILTHGN